LETQLLQTLAEAEPDSLWEEISSVPKTQRIDISLIVPVRNEAGNLPAVLPLIKKIPGVFEIIIVDATHTTKAFESPEDFCLTPE